MVIVMSITFAFNISINARASSASPDPALSPSPPWSLVSAINELIKNRFARARARVYNTCRANRVRNILHAFRESASHFFLPRARIEVSNCRTATELCRHVQGERADVART